MEAESKSMKGKIKRNNAGLVLLTDLLKINADRVERYKKAGYNILDTELKSVFYTIADESRKNITDISLLIMKSFGEGSASEPVRTGKVYRDWVEVNSRFNGNDNLLSACEFGEMVTIAAYTQAKDEATHQSTVELLDRQLDALKISLEIIKSYRQSYDKLDRFPK